MKIVKKKVSELIPYANNPRKNDDAVDKVASSIKNYGFKVPIIIDKNNEIIAGHTRLKAAKKLKIKEVPAVVADDLTPEQIKAFRIADNKVSEFSGWDFDILKNEILELKELDYEIENTGFDIDEIDELFPIDYAYKEEVEDEVPEVNKTPFIKRGDIITLGNHRFMCGDSTSKEDVEKLMDGNKADMLFTDPPYLMNFTGGIHSDGSKSFNSKHGKIKNDNMSEEKGKEFLGAINKMIKEFVEGAFYITFYRLGIDKYYESLDMVKLKVRSLIIWNKGNHTLSNSDYMSMYEPVFYGWVNKHNFYGGNNGRDIWEISRTIKNDLHPTMKPIELCEKAIKNSSQPNNKILDLFLGSGSTLIACEKTGRHCRGMELDEHYCDVIIKRWLDYTGQQTVEINGKEVYNEFTSHVEGDKND